MWALGVAGIVTALFTVSREAGPFVMRLALGSIAFMFITVQGARLARARAAAPARKARPPASQGHPHSRNRQRRAGRKR